MSHTPRGAQTNSKAVFSQLLGGQKALWADGCRLTTDTRTYVDFVCGLGPVILGYRHPFVDNAVIEQISLRGVSFSLPTDLEERLAAKLAELIPCAEQTRFLKNGADTLEGAVRIARAHTGRDYVLRCGYHGMHDWCVDSRGIPGDVRRFTLPMAYGTFPSVQGDAIAAVIMEPVIAQTGVSPPPHYLDTLRGWCLRNGALLIFDEVVTGFRCDLQGAQTLYAVTPDLACFSKALANGYPISALCGRQSYMNLLEPEGGVFVSTTFGGDPIGLTAALATIEVLEQEDVLPRLGVFGEQMRGRLLEIAKTHGIGLEVHGYPQRLVCHFEDRAQGERFNQSLLDQGFLTNGAYNLMLAHLEEPNLLDRLSDAWTTTAAGA